MSRLCIIKHTSYGSGDKYCLSFCLLKLHLIKRSHAHSVTTITRLMMIVLWCQSRECVQEPKQSRTCVDDRIIGRISWKWQGHAHQKGSVLHKENYNDNRLNSCFNTILMTECINRFSLLKMHAKSYFSQWLFSLLLHSNIPQFFCMQ